MRARDASEPGSPSSAGSLQRGRCRPLLPLRPASPGHSAAQSTGKHESQKASPAEPTQGRPAPNIALGGKGHQPDTGEPTTYELSSKRVAQSRVHFWCPMNKVVKGTIFLSTYNELRAGDTKTNEKWPLPQNKMLTIRWGRRTRTDAA